MKSEKVQELMMGAVVVVLAFALWRNFAPAKAPTGAKSAPRITPLVPAGWASQGAPDWGSVMSANQIEYGVVTGRPLDELQSADDLMFDALNYRGVPDVKRDSVFLQGAGFIF